MDTFLEILKLVYPSKTEDELKLLAEKCDSFSVREYYESDWKEVDRVDLEEEGVQLRLVKTFYQLGVGYYGVGNEIINSLNLWGGDNLEFDYYSEETSEFLSIFYCLLGFTYFDLQDYNRQIYLLASRFLPLAVTLDLPVYKNVQKCFFATCNISIIKDLVVFFKESIASNPTFIGSDENGHVISKWIEIFNEFKIANPKETEKITAFSAKEKELNNLNSDDKTVLLEILKLYEDLVSEKIWRENNEILCMHLKQQKSGKQIDEVEEYFKMLEKIDNINSWLEDRKEVVDWIKQTNREEAGKKAVDVLKKKVDLNNQEQSALATLFLEDLKNAGLMKSDEILYFDEADNKFKWSV